MPFTPPGGTVLASDTFLRVNESPLNPSTWTIYNGEFLGVVSSVCQVTYTTSGFGSELYTGILWPNDQWAQYQLVGFASIDSTVGIYLRTTLGAGNTTFTGGYYLVVNGGQGGILNLATSTQIGSYFPCILNIGDTITFVVQGTLLSFYQNSTLLYSIYDSNFVSGNAGIQLAIIASSPDQIINFIGGAIGGNNVVSFPNVNAMYKWVNNYFPGVSNESQDFLQLIRQSDGTILGWIDQNGFPQGSLSVTGSVVSVNGNVIINPNFIAGANVSLNVSGSGVTVNASSGGLTFQNGEIVEITGGGFTGTLDFVPTSSFFLLMKNGQLILGGGADYSITGNTITLTVQAALTDIYAAWYTY